MGADKGAFFGVDLSLTLLGINLDAPEVTELPNA
jgi:hypothetical protein